MLEWKWAYGDEDHAWRKQCAKKWIKSEEKKKKRKKKNYTIEWCGDKR